MEVSLDSGHIVLDGDQAPSESGTAADPHFLGHVYCRQTAGWIKMPLGTEVGLSPGNIVLHGDPAPSLQKRRAHPQFSAHVCCGQTAGWMNHEDATWYGGRPLPRRHCVRGLGTQLPNGKGHNIPTSRPMSIVVKWLDGLMLDGWMDPILIGTNETKPNPNPNTDPNPNPTYPTDPTKPYHLTVLFKV